MERIKFVLVEKSYLIRKGIASIINRIEHATVVKELDSLDTVNSTLQKYQPDFIIVNISLLNEMAKFRNLEIHTEMSQVGIGIDSTNEPSAKPKEPLREIISTLDERDDIYKKLQALIQEKLENQNTVQHSELSEREKTILMLVARGMTNKEIAEKLFLSTHTVITHRKNITNKLGIKSISGLTVYAILNDIIRIEELK